MGAEGGLGDGLRICCEINDDYGLLITMLLSDKERRLRVLAMVRAPFGYYDILYDLLIVVTDVMRREQIPFVADYGTLLGVVRHRGFVPWDFDVDLAMLSQDKSAALAALVEHCPSEYEVEDKGYIEIRAPSPLGNPRVQIGRLDARSSRSHLLDISPEETLLPSCVLPFYDITLPCPVRYSKVLDDLYGDRWPTNDARGRPLRSFAPRRLKSR